MLSLKGVLIPLSTFIAIIVVSEGITFLFFYYTKFPTLKKQWLILAQQFDLKTIIKPYARFFRWGNSVNLEASGNIQNYPVFFSWVKLPKSELGEFICKIEIKNPHKVAFFLKKGIMLIGKKRLAFETPYFKEKFSISTNNIEEISQVFNEEIQHKVRRIFAIELDANLTIERTKSKTNSNDILDATDRYSLVYYNPNYQINNKRQNIFIQETLLSILDIAKRIDASH